MPFESNIAFLQCTMPIEQIAYENVSLRKLLLGIKHINHRLTRSELLLV